MSSEERKMVRIITSPEKGLTAIELLIIVSVVAVLVIFTAPLLSGSKSEFDQAVKITESTVEQARQTARFYKTNVLIRLETDEQKNHQSITLSIPRIKSQSVLNEVTEEFQLPEGIQVISEDQVIHFDERGEIAIPAQLLFVSDRLKDQSRQLVIR
jgi:Tfp pilus assembly protein FimT